MPVIELTERHLGIPRTLAQKYAKNDELLMDDMESAGMVALVEASRTYPEDVACSPQTWLWKSVENAVKSAFRDANAQKRGRDKTIISMDYRGDHDGDGFGSSQGEECPPEAELETSEEVERYLRNLPPLERAAFMLIKGRGMQWREAAKLLGVSHGWFWELLQNAEQHIQRSVACREGWEDAGKAPDKSGDALLQWMRKFPDVAKRARDKARRAAMKVVAQRPVARRAEGRIKKHHAWYLADHAEKKLYGDWPTAREALAAVGVKTDILQGGGAGRLFVSACLGWPFLSASGAQVLAALLEIESASQKTLREKTGLGKMAVANAIRELYKDGWITPPNAAQGNKNNRSSYSATAKAVEDRGRCTNLIPLKGPEAQAFADQGYEVLPSHLVLGAGE